MRLAGTWKQYSAKAISQLTVMAVSSGTLRNFRWPYQAIVMNRFEQNRSRTVIMMPESYHVTPLLLTEPADLSCANLHDRAGIFPRRLPLPHLRAESRLVIRLRHLGSGLATPLPPTLPELLALLGSHLLPARH